ncbi:alpha/beta-hydrolase [Tylopilus felleus]
MLMSSVLLAFLTTSTRVAGAAPTVTLDNATVTGVTSGFTKQFLGIPFAHPPTGNLRFRLPQPLPPYNDFSALTYGPLCSQQPPVQFWPSNLPAETLNYLGTLLLNTATSSEDCAHNSSLQCKRLVVTDDIGLMLNVVTPANATTESKLPVIVWIYPGAFMFDGTPISNGPSIVEQGISIGIPAVYVSMNFRQTAFGFLASQEVKDAGVGNIGLQDQRLALRWVQKYISAFGGDPTKVTLWGYSSGSICVAMHMVTNGGNPEGLFRAAIMQGDITHGQPYYDALVAETGCSGANDTLQCLREVPYDVLLYGVSQSPVPLSYQSLNLPWMPRVDGVFLTESPMDLVQQGVVANVPFISGNCDGEGTLFSLGNANITTDAQFAEYMATNYLPRAPRDTIEQMMKYYPSDPTQGSPFDTGYLNVLTPQFKRLAAVQGDAFFQALRRFLLQNRSGKQNIWTHLSKRLKAVPFLGSFHASDLTDAYGLTDMSSYFLRFVANLDPNVGVSTNLYWPQYDATTQTMLELLDGLVPQTLITDTYRAEEIAYLTSLMLANPL